MRILSAKSAIFCCVVACLSACDCDPGYYTCVSFNSDTAERIDRAVKPLSDDPTINVDCCPCSDLGRYSDICAEPECDTRWDTSLNPGFNGRCAWDYICDCVDLYECTEASCDNRCYDEAIIACGYDEQHMDMQYTGLADVD